MKTFAKFFTVRYELPQVKLQYNSPLILGIRNRNMPRVALFALFVAGWVLVNCGAW